MKNKLLTLITKPKYGNRYCYVNLSFISVERCPYCVIKDYRKRCLLFNTGIKRGRCLRCKNEYK